MRIHKILYPVLCLVITLMFGFILTRSNRVWAAPTPTTTEKTNNTTATPSGNVSQKIKQIELLKEKIATKVAEIREKDKYALFGTIKKLDTSNLLLTAKDGEHKISFSEDTIFYDLTGTERKESKLDKFTEGNTVSVFGYYNEDKSVLSAKYVYLEPQNLNLIGQIVDIDKENFTITVKTKNGTPQVVDVESTTKLSSYGKDKKLVKLGFTKMAIQDPVHVFARSLTKDTDKLSGTKIYVLSGLFTSPSPTITPQISKEATKSPTAAKKSPTASPAPTSSP